ncbi:MAG: hypothetical protein WCG42_07745 [Parachlamydiaceae bacterium]
MKKMIVLSGLLFLSNVSYLQGHSHRVYVEEVPVAPVVVVNEASPVVVNQIDGEAPIVVNQEPPAPIVEEIGVAPGPDYVCVPGSWEWNDRWVWKKHVWVARPHPYAVWEPAHWHWSHHHNGYIFEPGHWR